MASRQGEKINQLEDSLKLHLDGATLRHQTLPSTNDEEIPCQFVNKTKTILM